jgi:subtilisin family serine protease
MSSIWNKLDSGLTSIYMNYLQVKEKGPASVAKVHPVVAEGGRLHVTMAFTGDLGELEPLGAQALRTENPGLAVVALDLADLERIAEHPNVIKLSYGQAPKLMLDKSVPEIHARDVWDVADGVFSGTTGKGVIIGVIDTGIDVYHPYFRKNDAPKTTRVLRIWDMGLEPQSGDTQPDPAFLSGGAGTYGVEYDQAKIMAAFGGLGNYRHRDCAGHGTHVASIAAGNGKDEYQFIGVAPEADLIVVKYLHLETHPKVGGTDVDFGAMFRDAVTYILRVAKNVFNRPVVINCSFGSDLGPHDGFTVDEDFLTKTFDGAVGQVLVQSAGNSGSTNNAGNVTLPQHARIEFPPLGDTVEIPVILFDERTDRIEYDNCRGEDPTEELYLRLYYPDGATRISAGIFLPDSSGPLLVDGPDFGNAPVTGTFSSREYKLSHSAETDPLSWTGRGTVTRSKFEVEITPHNKMHRTGEYRLRISSPGELTVHLYCDQSDYGFVIDDSSVPANVHAEDRFLVGSDAGAGNIIAVAAYTAEQLDLPIANFSSRGPLVDYGSGIAQPKKPEISAPGVSVDAAYSKNVRDRGKRDRTTAKSGTSMSAPHVAGAVALLLSKNKNLTSAQVLSILQTHADPREIGETEEELGAGRLNVKRAFDNTPV